MNFIWIIWFLAGAVLAIFEIFTTTFFLLPIGISCFLASIISFFLPYNMIYIPIIVCIISSILMLIFIRPLCVKFLFNKNAPKSNVDAIIGKTFIAQSDISSTTQGTVKIYSDVWNALAENNETINAGERVEVVRIDGNILFVKKN